MSNLPPPKTPNATIQQLVQRLHNPFLQYLSQNSSTEKSTFGEGGIEMSLDTQSRLQDIKNKWTQQSGGKE